MHWNYRLVRVEPKAAEDEAFYEIHEVYYDDDHTPNGMTINPVTAGSETPEGVAEVLEMMLRDVRNRPVFVPPAAWAHDEEDGSL